MFLKVSSLLRPDLLLELGLPLGSGCLFSHLLKQMLKKARFGRTHVEYRDFKKECNVWNGWPETDQASTVNAHSPVTTIDWMERLIKNAGDLTRLEIYVSQTKRCRFDHLRWTVGAQQPPTCSRTTSI